MGPLQEAGVVADLEQALELEALAPPRPMVAGSALEGAGLTAEPGDPLAAELGDVAQAAPGKQLEAEETIQQLSNPPC